MQIKLTELLSYENAKIISRYKKDYPNAKMQAEEALKELMKFIWLCHKHKSDKAHHPNNDNFNFSCIVHSEMKDIDNMWHTFLLFTRDYHEFCHIYLNGVYFHHDPILETDPSFSEESYKIELDRYLSYIYENLGEDTLKRWFNEFFN